MLQAGDLIDVQTDEGPQRYLVTRVVPDKNEARVIDPASVSSFIALNLDETGGCVRVAFPLTEWPYLQTPKNVRGMPSEVAVPNLNGSRRPLRFLYDWLLSEPLRSGGALFLHPSLNLRPKNHLILTYNGRPVSVRVPQQFGTLAQRYKRMQPPSPKVRSFYERLLDDDFGDEE